MGDLLRNLPRGQWNLNNHQLQPASVEEHLLSSLELTRQTLNQMDYSSRKHTSDTTVS